MQPHEPSRENEATGTIIIFTYNNQRDNCVDIAIHTW